MTQKHTPGEWYILHAHKMGNGYYAAGATHQILPDKYDKKKGLPVASVFVSSKNAEANTRLIAAAPELLEVLEDHPGDLATDKQKAKWCKRRDAVIAKAGGSNKKP